MEMTVPLEQASEERPRGVRRAGQDFGRNESVRRRALDPTQPLQPTDKIPRLELDVDISAPLTFCDLVRGEPEDPIHKDPDSIHNLDILGATVMMKRPPEVVQPSAM